MSTPRTIAGQIEYLRPRSDGRRWTTRPAVSFIAESLAALAESRTEVTDFAP